jgi:hypothetical protein
MSDTTKWLLGLFVFAVFGAAIVLGTALMGCDNLERRPEHHIEKGPPTRFDIALDHCNSSGYCVYLLTDTFTGCKRVVVGPKYVDSYAGVAVFKLDAEKCRE